MDKELQAQFDAINNRLDGLAGKGKPGASVWKRVTIAVPVAVAIIGLLGTGYELGLRFLENQSNRQTIHFYTTLAQSLIENGHYEVAKVYLIEAEEIDANNSSVISTKAFIDMMDLIRSSVKANPEALANATYNLSKLNLRDEEMFYHIGTVASQECDFDISEEYFLKIEPAANRFSLRARARLISDVYLRNLEGGRTVTKEEDEIIQITMEMLPPLIQDVLQYKEDNKLTGNLMEQV